MGRRFSRDDNFRRYRNADYGTCRERSLRSGSRNGTERVFRLHRLLRSRFYLAAGFVNGIYLRCDQHYNYGHEDS